ncbi:hypothetical protein M378DRAFT_17772 [Amanita muscaria Koide BX008]|uniref:Uncharacterized protein n=1 Tax=Amanita muscaria (strain Koide BX008) TaxID=946122 RepID=A0A0C2WHN8_AMAMK|nr:hypothetical protein M378DRAFT_17772 [Amanita muscaria Koide BX008]
MCRAIANYLLKKGLVWPDVNHLESVHVEDARGFVSNLGELVQDEKISHLLVYTQLQALVSETLPSAKISARNNRRKRSLAEMFGHFVTLAKKILDYRDEAMAMADPKMEMKDTEIDDELGVAVVLDDKEQEE